MNIAGDYLFDAPRHVVWNALQDHTVLESVLPGGEGFERVDENEYKGTLEVKVGPVQGKFQGELRLSDFKAPESYWMEVDGKGPTGVVKASGRLRLEERGSQTYMEYEGTAHVSGRIASVGSRLVENAARSLIRQGLESLHEHLKREMQQHPATASAPSTPATGTVSASASRSASQPTPEASGILGMLNDLIPAQYQPWLLGGVAVIIVLIIVLLASR